MPVIIPQESGRPATVDRQTATYVSSASIDAWRTLGRLGAVFFVLGMIDIMLGWYPMRLGSPQWEFGTISTTLSALTIPTLALYLMLSAAISSERRRMVKAVGIGMAVMGVFILGLAILYITTVPLALRSVATNDMAALTLKKAIFKWLVLFLGYETLYVMGALTGLRRRSGS